MDRYENLWPPLSPSPHILVGVARTHWFGEDVDSIDTTLEAAPSLMPTFDRAPFGANRFHDVIARRPTGGTDPLLVGLVSHLLH